MKFISYRYLVYRMVRSL